MTAPECCTSTVGKKCCPCKKMPAVFVILFGLTFLLREVGVISYHVAAVTWPIIVILAGAQFICRDSCKCCKTEPK